jgi:Leucine-rich repeat (LRR) protein
MAASSGGFVILPARVRALVRLLSILLAVLLLRVDSREPAVAQQTQIPQGEYGALVALYEATGGTHWTNPWTLPTAEPCSLYGVTCESGHVTGLGLGSNGLSGTIPPELGNLSSLQGLSLSWNELSGAIPPELGNLSGLLTLQLGGNQLSGTIPPELGNLSSLQNLSLSSNQLSGTIPPELGNLSSLQSLYLFSNQLSGAIPPELGNLSSLQALDLSYNQLSGAIPLELANLSNLRWLYLDSNQLSGAIPRWLGSLGSLQGLYLSSNWLSGAIPPELGSLGSLQYLALDSNELSGVIPQELGNLSNLQGLYLYSNRLSGAIPQWSGSLLGLKQLYLCSNQFSGTIPPELGNLSSLLELELGENQLGGTIPPELGNLGSLQHLTLGSNQLSGAIPQELGNLSIFWLDLDYNMLWSDVQSPLAFLDQKAPGWADTQTVPPSDVRVDPTVPGGVRASWNPIPYTGDDGRYEVGLATTSGGPYAVVATTADKTAASAIFTGLTPGTPYYLAVRTFTRAHDEQQNDLLSPYGEEVAFAVPDNVTPTPTATRQATPNTSRLVLPLALRQPTPTPTPTATPWCDLYEPNDDRRTNPWGPLTLEVTYSAKLCRGDPEDNYTFDVPRAGSGSVDLTLPGALVGRSHILVYATSDLDRVVADHGPIRDASYRLAFDASQAGRYVVRLYASAWDDVSPYELRVSVP